MKSRFRTFLRSAFALATLSLIVPSASAQEKSKVSENAKGAAATQDVSGKSSDDDKKAEATKAENAQFIRITRDKDGEPLELQTNIIPYTIEEGEFAGMQVDLIGAVHIAHREYFQLLNKKFRNYDACSTNWWPIQKPTFQSRSRMKTFAIRSERFKSA